MSIQYSDGTTVEGRILELLKASQDLRASKAVSEENYGEWAVEYHLCPERSNLFRHLDLTGLDALELGAGMGGVSRYVAENARSLTVVEGTQARFDALSSRLRDLKNWKGKVCNIQDFQTEERFDVVFVIGVLEYSELYVTPDPTIPDGPFGRFLRHAASFLKEDGVLVLAIENKLGLKYWSGAAEDHSGKMFDGIAGYPPRRCARTFSRRELLGLVERAGFKRTEEYFPFPDYKIPSTVLSKTFVDRTPDMAADMAKGAPFQNYGAPRSTVFPELLAMHSVAQAGLLAEFSNSFLMVSSLDPKSRTLGRILGRTEQSREVAWHYSMRRRYPCVTRFVDKGASHEWSVRKMPLQEGGGEQQVEGFHWQPPVDHPAVLGTQLRTALVRRLYFQDWKGFVEELTAFLSWSLKHWSQGDDLRPEALDAVYLNAVIPADALDGGHGALPAEYRLFDLEWSAPQGVSKSWFVLRNVFGLIRELEFFSQGAPFQSFADLYELLCRGLGVVPKLEGDLLREARFQHVASGSRGYEKHLQQLRDLFARSLQAPAFPRVPALEARIRSKIPGPDATRLDFALHKAAGMAAQGVRRALRKIGLPSNTGNPR